MTEGEKIVALMRQADRLFQQVSKLLMSIDAQMLQHGWEFKENKATSVNNAIWRPKEWVPQDVYRFYSSKESGSSHLLGYVAVLLWDRERDAPFEPLISAGCFNFGVGNAVNKQWDYWFARLHLAHSQRSEDGSLVRSTASSLVSANPVHFQTLESFAVPLISIADAEHAETRIVKPLIKLLQNSVTAGDAL